MRRARSGSEIPSIYLQYTHPKNLDKMEYSASISQVRTAEPNIPMKEALTQAKKELATNPLPASVYTAMLSGIQASIAKMTTGCMQVVTTIPMELPAPKERLERIAVQTQDPKLVKANDFAKEVKAHMDGTYTLLPQYSPALLAAASVAVKRFATLPPERYFQLEVDAFYDLPPEDKVAEYRGIYSRSLENCPVEDQGLLVNLLPSPRLELFTLKQSCGIPRTKVTLHNLLALSHWLQPVEKACEVQILSYLTTVICEGVAQALHVQDTENLPNLSADKLLLAHLLQKQP